MLLIPPHLTNVHSLSVTQPKAPHPPATLPKNGPAPTSPSTFSQCCEEVLDLLPNVQPEASYPGGRKNAQTFRAPEDTVKNIYTVLILFLSRYPNQNVPFYLRCNIRECYT